MAPIRVLIADDQRIFWATVRRKLAAVPEVEIIGEAADGQQAVSMAVELEPDILLMDIAMPVLNGIEATRRIVRQCPQTQIVGVSIYDNSGMEEIMRSAGSKGPGVRRARGDDREPRLVSSRAHRGNPGGSAETAIGRVTPTVGIWSFGPGREAARRTAEAMIYISMIHLMARRLAKAES